MIPSNAMLMQRDLISAFHDNAFGVDVDVRTQALLRLSSGLMFLSFFRTIIALWFSIMRGNLKRLYRHFVISLHICAILKLAVQCGSSFASILSAVSSSIL